MIRILYRLSDKGFIKEKLPHATKEHCLQNAINVFGHDQFYVFADNCNDDTIKMIKSKGVNVFQTNLGNCGSWRNCAEFAIKNFSRETFVYFLEDDYLHTKSARKGLLEGLQIADYVTLYDHPDKYMNGINPYVKDGAELSKVYLTETTHWKETSSTSMTFATRVDVLIEDRKLWWKYTSGSYPNDFMAFKELTKNFLFKKKNKRRKIISSLPAMSTHSEKKWLSPLIDWKEI